jgi:hypothetical protein
MIAARRTTRFIAALALAGLMLGSSPLAPRPLAASRLSTSSSVSSAFLCGYVAQAITFLARFQGNPFASFLLAQLSAYQASHCS